MARSLRVAAGLAILAFLVLRLGSGPFVMAVRVVDLRSVLLVLVIGAVTTLLSAWRWVLVARGLAVRLPLGRAVADYYRALLLNGVLPGGVLGDVHRAVRHGRDLGDTARAAKAVVLERFAGAVALAVVSGTVLAATPSVRAILPRAELKAVLLAAVFGLAAAVVAIRIVLADRSRWAARARAALDDARCALFCPGTRGVIALASVGVVAGHLATFVVAARAAGVTAGIDRLAPLLLIALVAMALPLNVGGWGPREGAAAGAFAAAGLGAAQGLTTAVVYGLLVLVAAAPGAAVLAWQARPVRQARQARTAAALVPEQPAAGVTPERQPVNR